jgi:uncharacterized membrane protein YphA (DoxX/SURF4 family)
MHFMNANQFAGMVPSFVPGGVFWVYLTGAALLAAAVSFIIKKHVQLAGQLLAALMLVFVFTVHLPSIIGGNMMSMGSLLKDMSLAGGSLLFASMFGDNTD